MPSITPSTSKVGGKNGARSASLLIGISVPPTVDVVTVRIVLSELLMCFASPPYVLKILWIPLPTEVGEYDTEQAAVAPVPLRLQVFVLKEPVPFEEKNIVPVGVLAPEPDTSVTTALQVVMLLTGSEDGVQVRLVVVKWPDITETVLRPEFAT